MSIDNKDKNCLYSEESLGFIKYEIDIEGTCFKSECDSAYEDNQYLTSLISDKKKVTNNDNNDELCSRIVAGSDKNPGINKSNRFSSKSIDDNQDKMKGNNESSDKDIYDIIVLNDPQTGRKRYQCNICDKSSSSKSNLRKHILRHNGEKHFKCNICGKKLSAKSVLKKHLLIHTREKAHQCNICDKKFTHRGDLKRHLYVHTGEKPYQCVICNRSFKRKGTLKIHLLQWRKVHPRNPRSAGWPSIRRGLVLKGLNKG